MKGKTPLTYLIPKQMKHIADRLRRQARRSKSRKLQVSPWKYPEA